MSLLTINGVAIPTPSDIAVSVQDISQAERNANGTMIIERIATKRKIEMTWKFLNKDDMSSVLKLVSSVFFTVNYLDPQDNNTRSGTFYVGDRKCGMMDFQNGVPRYKDISFNFIER